MSDSNSTAGPGRPRKDNGRRQAVSRSEAAIEDLRRKGGVFVEAVRATPLPMVVTDATLPGNPIVYANQSFVQLSGYPFDELIGRQPHFMDGPDTDPDDARRFRDALERSQDVQVETVQYRKDGTRLVVSVFLSPLNDDSGTVRHHFLSYLDVTERVEGQARTMRQTEQQYRMLFDAIDEGFCIIQMIFDDEGRPADYRFEEVNAAFARQTGLANATGRTIRSFRPAHEQHWFDTYGRIARTGQAERFEAPAAELGFYYEVLAFPVGKPAEAKVGVLFRDVADRRRSQQALRESERRFRLIVDSARDYAIFTTDPNGIVTDWYAGAEAVFGYRRNEIVGQPISTLFVPEEVAAGVPEEELARARAEGRAPDVRWHLRQDGSRAFIEGSTEALRDSDGQLHGFLKIGQDVTERRAAERALRESRRRQRALIEGIPQLVWRATGGGHWTWSSPQWSAYTGLSEEASRGLGWLGAVHPDDREPARTAWSAAARGERLEMETRLYHAEERRYRWFRTRATPVHDDGGEVVEWLGTSTDIDDLRRLQDQQHVLVGELQHRTRNLIAVVQSVAEQTIRNSDGLEDFRARFGGRLNALSRIQGLLSRSEMRAITIEDLVRMELDALGGGQAGERVKVEGPPVPLWSGMVQTLSLALHELATNARKYGALAGAAGQLLVRWRVSGPKEDFPRLELEWREEGVPLGSDRPIRPGGGYGRKLIERALPYTLGATTEYRLDDTGLLCRIEIPLRHSLGRES